MRTIPDQLEVEVESIIKSKKDKTGGKIDLNSKEWRKIMHDVIEIGRDIRDGKISNAESLVSELKDIKEIRDLFSDRDFRDVTGGMKNSFRKEIED